MSENMGRDLLLSHLSSIWVSDLEKSDLDLYLGVVGCSLPIVDETQRPIDWVRQPMGLGQESMVHMAIELE